jgi:hypothetical protein
MKIIYTAGIIIWVEKRFFMEIFRPGWDEMVASR